MSIALIRLCDSVCLSVRTINPKTAETKITKLGTGIVHYDTLPPIYSAPQLVGRELAAPPQEPHPRSSPSTTCRRRPVFPMLTHVSPLLTLPHGRRSSPNFLVCRELRSRPSVYSATQSCHCRRLQWVDPTTLAAMLCHSEKASHMCYYYSLLYMLVGSCGPERVYIYIYIL